MTKALLIAVAAAFALAACGQDSSKKGPASSSPSSSPSTSAPSSSPSTPPSASSPSTPSSGAPAAGGSAAPSSPDAKKDEKK